MDKLSASTSPHAAGGVHPARTALIVYDMQVGVVRQIADGARSPDEWWTWSRPPGPAAIG